MRSLGRNGNAVWTIGAALALIAAAPLVAQTASLRGTVRDESGRPLVAARIATLDDTRATVSDTAGAFVLSGLAPGMSTFTLRRIGYEPTRFSVEILSGEPTDVQLRLTATPIKLPAVEVQAAITPEVVLAKFNDHRASAGGGHFITREDIERARPHQLSDMLRGIPGLSLPARSVGERSVRVNRSNLGVFHDCPVEYWVDGMRVTEFSIDEMAPNSVEAMEVYAGPATLPPEYRTVNGTASCGVIAIWTRIPR